MDRLEESLYKLVFTNVFIKSCILSLVIIQAMFWVSTQKMNNVL